MSDHSFKKADAIIELDCRDLRIVFAKVSLLQEINSKISNYLDPNIAPYCQVANMTENKLILIVANGSVATQIRFQKMDLLKKCKQHPELQNIQQIECKVRPPEQRGEGIRSSYAPSLSSQAAYIIREMAETLEDPKLKEVMERIAGRVK